MPRRSSLKLGALSLLLLPFDRSTASDSRRSVLAVPDITVTNAKDKDLQLPVILKANLHAKEVLAIMAGTENGRKPPPAGGGAGIFLGCWKGGRHQAKVESEL